MQIRRGSIALLLLVASGTFGWSLLAHQTDGAAHVDVNDISYLWPVPATQADVDALITADAATADGMSIWPEPLFQQVMDKAQKTSVVNLAGTLNTIKFAENTAAFLKRATWKVVSFRVDPDSNAGHADLHARFGEIPQLRLILQPVTVSAAGKVRIHDYTAHLVFAYIDPAKPTPPFRGDQSKFAEIVRELKTLKEQSPAPTSGKLGVHPGLATGDREFARKVETFVTKYASPLRLFAVSFMGIEPPEPWIFFALRVNPKAGVEEAGQEVLGGSHAQMLGFLQTPRALPVPKFMNVDKAAGKGVSTGVLFDENTLAHLDDIAVPGATPLRFRDIPDYIANPERAHFFNTDCVSCHSESAKRLEVSSGGGAFAYQLPAGISGVDERLLPKSEWNVRNFGWFKTDATVTMRAANEAAASAEIVNHAYLDASPAAKPQTKGAMLIRASVTRSKPPSLLTFTSKPASTAAPTIAPPGPKENPAMSEPIARPLTLVMNFKSVEEGRKLKKTLEHLQSLPPEQSELKKALTNLKMVHFARFVFLNENQLAVITTYDGKFEDYVDAFVNAIGGVFDVILAHMKDWPHTSVSDHREEFLEYVRKHDLSCMPPFYSAYPQLSVQDILALQKQHAGGH